MNDRDNAERQAGAAGVATGSKDTKLDGVYSLLNDVNHKSAIIRERLNDLLARVNGPTPTTSEDKPVQEVTSGHLGKMNKSVEDTLSILDDISEQVSALEQFA